MSITATHARIRSVTVYCSSSGALEEHFFEGAHHLGRALAQRGLDMVYSGGSNGLMGECAPNQQGSRRPSGRDHHREARRTRARMGRLR